MARVPRGESLDVLRPQPPLRSRDVPDEITRRKTTLIGGPLDPVLGNAVGDAPGTLAHALVVGEELVDIGDFHGGLRPGVVDVPGW